MEQIVHDSNYQLVRLIGEGGMGSVYEATLQEGRRVRKEMYRKNR